MATGNDWLYCRDREALRAEWEMHCVSLLEAFCRALALEKTEPTHA